MKEVVINKCYGGFSLSLKGEALYAKLSGEPVEDFCAGRDLDRDDPILIQVVKQLGEESWGEFAKLEIIEIPDDVPYYIDSYDGMEHVAERHRTWG